ncbi:MAG: hypothetical protein IJZ79_05120 [Bacilli bacterium]|nr:hypothetical protein [Bacilli bacterium]
MFIEEKTKKEIYNSVKRTIQFKDDTCKCCCKSIALKPCFTVLRYTGEEDKFDKWYYCHECFDSVSEVLVDILIDSHPYGIYPLDKNKEILSSLFPSWAPELPMVKGERNIEYFQYTNDGEVIKKRKR